MTGRPALGVALLAAGSSRRMRQPKLLLRWGATSILGHQVAVWRQLGATQTAVVWAARDEAMRVELDRLSIPGRDRIPNPHPEQDMFSSVRRAARWAGWAPGLTHWAISLGDQPQVRLETLATLLEQSTLHPDDVCQPRWHGRLWHPVLMPKRVFVRLANYQGATLREFLRGLPEAIRGCDVDDPGLALDIDEPADYAKALALVRRARGAESS